MIVSEKPPVQEESSHDMVGHPKTLEAGVAGSETSGKEDDVIIVSWDGPHDPTNPKNWSFKKKWIITTVVSAYTLLSPISSSMIAPAAEVVAREFHITSSVVLSMTFSIFILAYGFGPLLLGPLSEIYGRVRVIQGSNLFYLVFNLACGFSRSTTQLIVFRLLAGLGGSAPLAIGGGVLGDCWAPEERGQAVAIYSLAPVLGPVVGPIVGSWIAEKSNWRWVFWSTSIFCGFVQIIGFVLLRETFAPLILEHKASRIRRDMGLSPGDHFHVRTQYETSDRQWQQVLSRAMLRPFAMFFYEPILQLLGIYMAFAYGLLFLILGTLPSIFQGIYGFHGGIAGLHYIALGIGLTGASQVNARILDRVYKYFKTRNGGVGKPEFRLPNMVPGAFSLPIGLLIFGWSAQKHVFWLVPDIGLVIIGAGTILIYQGIQTYVIDAFTLHAASALAAVSFLRSLAGFAFPLFAPAMYSALGYGKGDTILAAFAIGVGCPAPFLFWRYGERIRNRSRYASART